MGKETMVRPYELLANAIVVEAVREYVETVRMIKELRKESNEERRELQLQCCLLILYGKPWKETKRYVLFRRLRKIESFIRSNWYRFLTDVMPEPVLKKLREEMIGHDTKRVS